jgi:hypothetical protein
MRRNRCQAGKLQREPLTWSPVPLCVHSAASAWCRCQPDCGQGAIRIGLTASANDGLGGAGEGPSSALLRRGEDPELVDLSVDRGPGHAQRLRGLRLVAVGVKQTLRDGVALDRLQRAEEPAAEGPGLGG